MHPRPGRNGNWRQRPGRNSNLRPRPGGVLLLGAWCLVPCAWCLVHGAWRRSQIQLQSQIQIQHPNSADMNRPVFRVGTNWDTGYLKLASPLFTVSKRGQFQIRAFMKLALPSVLPCRFPGSVNFHGCVASPTPHPHTIPRVVAGAR